MTSTLARVQDLIAQDDVKFSEHAYNEMRKDSLTDVDVLSGVSKAELVEDYPTYAKGPCSLVLQHDTCGQPIHALWGLRRGTHRPAVLITVYRPDPAQWTPDFKVRR